MRKNAKRIVVAIVAILLTPMLFGPLAIAEDTSCGWSPGVQINRCTSKVFGSQLPINYDTTITSVLPVQLVSNPTSTSTSTATSTATLSHTEVGTGTASATLTGSGTATATYGAQTWTSAYTSTSGQTATGSLITITMTWTATGTTTGTNTRYVTATGTKTDTATLTGTTTSTVSKSSTLTAAATITGSATVTATASITGSGGGTATASGTATMTATAAATKTVSTVGTATQSATATAVAIRRSLIEFTVAGTGTGTVTKLDNSDRVATHTYLGTATGTTSSSATETLSGTVTGTATVTGTVTGSHHITTTTTITLTSTVTGTAAYLYASPKVQLDLTSLTIAPTVYEFLTSNYSTDLTIHAGFDPAPYNSGGGTTTITASPIPYTPAYFGGGTNTIHLIDRNIYWSSPYPTSKARYLRQGYGRVRLVAKATSAATVSFVFGTCNTETSLSDVGVSTVILSVTSSSYVEVDGTITFPAGGVVVPPNYSFCTQMIASTYSGTPTVTIAMGDSGYWTSVELPVQQNP